MKLHADTRQAYQTVTGYDAHSISINQIVFTHSLFVLPEHAPQTWPVRNFATLCAEDFAPLIDMHPDVLILGTGATQRFLAPGLSVGLHTRHIGVECMANDAACRTYNILMAEGRKVALALILEFTP